MTVTAPEEARGARPPARPDPRLHRIHSESNTRTQPHFTADADVASRPRCSRCGHPLTAVRSLARGLGRVCAVKAGVEALDARRDAVGRRLASLARLVAVLDAEGVERASEAVEVALEAVRGGDRDE